MKNIKELYKMFKNLNIKYHPKTVREEYVFDGISELFCPACGNTGIESSGNKVSFPEWWEEFHCDKCSFIVGWIDNSPFVHVLAEMKQEVFSEYDYISYISESVGLQQFGDELERIEKFGVKK